MKYRIENGGIMLVFIYCFYMILLKLKYILNCIIYYFVLFLQFYSLSYYIFTVFIKKKMSG